MAKGRAEFEVQAQRDERWVTEDIRDSEEAARGAAQGILSRGSCQAVRIVKCWERADGSVTETVVFNETRAVKDPKVTISQIDDAPLCRKTSEYYRLESRSTMSRLLRKYLEKLFITPTELIYNHKALSRFQEADSLFPSAVDRVATLQARASGEDSKARREEIFKAVTQMTQRARKAAENSDLAKIKGSEFGQLPARVAKIAPPDQVEFFTLVALSRDLMTFQSWLGKLDRLVELTRLDQDGAMVGLIDGVIADLIGVPAALQEMLGYQRNLGDALCAMADLSEGRFTPEQSDARDQIAALSPLLAAGRLEETKKTLLDRLFRQLAGGQPLSRQDPSKEGDVFRQVAERLLRPDGLLGGPEAAAALTKRYVFMLEGGGPTALRKAIGGTVSAVPNRIFQIVYLTELTASSLGEELSKDIVAVLTDVVRVDDIDALVGRSVPPKEKMTRVVRLYDRIGSTAALPERERAGMRDHLDSLLCEYLKRERIIERLDDPKARLRDRTTRLLDFCAAGVLPAQSRAQTLARDRVIAILRQPSFEQHFIEGVTDPNQCKEMLVGLHGLLVRGGFR